MVVNLLRRAFGIHSGRMSFDEIKGLVGRDDAVILEIGANDGSDSQRFAETFPGGRIFAFEPDPRAIARWKATVTADHVTLVETAIGNENGTITFHQSDGEVQDGPGTGWDLSGSIRAPKQHLERHPHIKFENTIDVPIRTLDSWAAETGIDRIDFLWADVQGAEKDLIRGAAETLAKTRYFYTEYDNREMYEGQWGLEQIAANLPHHRIVKRWKQDVLFGLKEG
jgi:FkbM family methyltransferase